PRRLSRSTLFPYTTLFRSDTAILGYNLEYGSEPAWHGFSVEGDGLYSKSFSPFDPLNNQKYYIEIFNRGNKELTYEIKTEDEWIDRKSTRLNSSHVKISYA